MIRKPAAILLVLSLAVLALALVPAAGLAAKGGGGGKPGGGGGGGGKPGGGGTTDSGSISLAYPLVNDANENGSPNHGDTVMFDVSTTATQPYVNLQCFRNGVLVAEGWRGYFDGALDTRYFTLWSPQWASGAAECVAYLNSSTSRGMQRLASASFHVDA